MRWWIIREEPGVQNTHNDFINEIINDTSFYEAFRNMKRYTFTAENRVFTYDKKNAVEGNIYRKIYHNNDGPYKMQFLEKKDEGKVYKKNGKFSNSKIRHVFSGLVN